MPEFTGTVGPAAWPTTSDFPDAGTTYLRYHYDFDDFETPSDNEAGRDQFLQDHPGGTVDGFEISVEPTEGKSILDQMVYGVKITGRRDLTPEEDTILQDGRFTEKDQLVSRLGEGVRGALKTFVEGAGLSAPDAGKDAPAVGR